MTPAHVVLDRGPRDLDLLGREQWGLVTQGTLIPDEALMRVLWAYSTQGNWPLQEEGLAEVTQRRAVSNSRLAHSVWPLVWG